MATLVRSKVSTRSSESPLSPPVSSAMLLMNAKASEGYRLKQTLLKHSDNALISEEERLPSMSESAVVKSTYGVLPATRCRSWRREPSRRNSESIHVSDARSLISNFNGVFPSSMARRSSLYPGGNLMVLSSRSSSPPLAFMALATRRISSNWAMHMGVSGATRSLDVIARLALVLMERRLAALSGRNLMPARVKIAETFSSRCIEGPSREMTPCLV
mmetsp:Transcript_22637/g.53533  ORF Transcript_22637/g.53533 Transcript_22637/m.53533 type:complete len:217 (+) Transcript_22637:236-886(+)